MGLAPAAVVVRADEDHRDVELAGLDVRDLEVGAALRSRSRRRRRRRRAARARRSRSAPRRLEQAPNDERRPPPAATAAWSAWRPWMSPPHESSGRRPDGLASARSQRDRAAGRTVPGRSGRPKDSRVGPVGRSARPERRARRVDAPRSGSRRGNPVPSRRDVRTDRAARRAPRHQRPAPGGALGLHRRVRPRRLAPRDRRPGRRRPFHGAPHLQGHDGLSHRPARSARRSRASAARSTPRPTANRRSTGSASRGARPTRAMDVIGELIVRPRLDDGRYPERARGHHRGDPLVPRRSRPSTARSCSRPRCSATGRSAARSAARRPDILALPDGGDPRLLADDVPAGEHGRRGRRRPRPRRGGRARRRRRSGPATAPSPASRPAPALPAGPRVRTGQARHEPGPALPRRARPSAATTRTAGRSPSSTPSSATG